MKDTLGFINIVAIMLYGNTYKFQLPPNVYYACGFNAYKWYIYGAVGSCTLARLTSATWVWDSKDIPYQQIPKHMLYKRSQRPKAKELVHLPWQKKFGLSLTLVGLSVQNAHTIEKLADLFDNVTEYVFDALNNTNAMAEQLILVTNQHAMVLDYLTASQGGMCQIVGPACCHYLNYDGVLQVKHDIEQARKLKEEFRKANSQDDWNPKWPEWLSWLNPANWFSGWSGWLSGILHTVLYVLLAGVGIYMLIKITLMLINSCCTSKRYPH